MCGLKYALLQVFYKHPERMLFFLCPSDPLGMLSSFDTLHLKCTQAQCFLIGCYLDHPSITARGILRSLLLVFAVYLSPKICFYFIYLGPPM